MLARELPPPHLERRGKKGQKFPYAAGVVLFLGGINGLKVLGS